ncbi:MAG: hypothetical protein FWH29_01925 [Methanobrevibacter sp.]|nr:hypothetical protein [Methanobrevibacter sp.]
MESVNLFGTSFKFKPSENMLDYIKENFATSLVGMLGNFDNKNGLVIIIDDVNGLSNTSDFANWYKSFADTLATNYRDESPIIMALAAYPEKLQMLHEHNPSFTRLFSHIELKGLLNKEISDFFTNAFNKMGMSVDEEAMKTMVKYSSGLPNMMQEIGNGIFYMRNRDKNIITKDDAFSGVLFAGDEIGKKYLQPLLDSSIRSPQYLDIFERIAKDVFSKNSNGEYFFRKKDFSEKLNDDEAKVFTDFLKRARKLKILEYYGPKKSGHYKFTNNLYPIYLAIQSLRK